MNANDLLKIIFDSNTNFAREYREQGYYLLVGERSWYIQREREAELLLMFIQELIQIGSKTPTEK